ncbi:hypothetical protein HZC00_05275 [Candidatus Kaiserbacteria bacterium]|nr:hypothetical protein [Candidatus Kaiserbacteria bacterium]
MNDRDTIVSIQAAQREMCRSLKRTSIISTVLLLALCAFTTPYTPYVGWTWGDFSNITILSAFFVVTLWTHYWLTRYRMKKGYFGDNAAEAEEIIGFAWRKHKNKRGT